MPKGKNQKAERARDLYLTGKKLVEIARELDVPEGTVRRWKSTYGWDGERSKKGSERSVKKSERSVLQELQKEKEFSEEIKLAAENDELTDKQRLFCILSFDRMSYMDVTPFNICTA